MRSERQYRATLFHTTQAWTCIGRNEGGLTMRKDRFIAGLILIAVAVALFLFSTDDSTSTVAIVLGVIGILLIGVSRRPLL